MIEGEFRGARERGACAGVQGERDAQTSGDRRCHRGAAYAQGDEPVDSECAQQLTTAQETVQDRVDNNALSEADQEKIYALMDEADALCTEGKSDEAIATLSTVNKMVAGQ
jgi:hypothetical protein